jgi:hypothetical protein
MLNNPNWDKNLTPVSIDDFIDWLETKDPAETYDYQNRLGNCCLGQYMAARNISWSFGGREDGYAKACTKVFGGIGFLHQEPLAGIGFGRETFGDCLKRTKAYKKTHAKALENA